MTTKVTVQLYGDVERSLTMWATIAGASIEDIVATALIDQILAWEKKLPEGIRELRDMHLTPPGVE